MISLLTPPTDQTILRVIATDNLVCANAARYPFSEFPALVRCLIGVAATVDHDWRAEKEWGRIRNAGIQSAPTPPALNAMDQLVVAKEGYQQIWADIETDDQNVLDRMERGLNLRLSIAISYTLQRCPDCICKAGDMRSYDCPNMPWDIPYYDRIGVADGIEISLVLAGAVRSARVLGVMESDE